MKKFLFIIISTLLAHGAGYAETHVPGGPVSGTWTLVGSPYLVEGEIGIRPGTALTIEPGVEVIFQRHFKFLIYGRLLAVGTEADSIAFLAADTTHGWHGLRFYDLTTQPDSSKLVYCKISYGRSSSYNNAGEDKNGGAIYCSNSDKLLISHCLIWNNRTGDVVGVDGEHGTGSWDPGDPGESVSSGCGGAIYLFRSNAFISSNHFYHNRTGDATGGHGGHGFSDMSGLNAMGSSGGAGGVANAGSGGAVYCVESSPYISGNAFSGNITGDAQGGDGGYGGDIDHVGGISYAGYGGRGGDGRGGSGGGIYLARSEAICDNNLLINNITGNGLGGDGGEGGINWPWNRDEPPGGRPAFNGDGGDGGNGYGGEGSAVFLTDEPPYLNNSTLSQNQAGNGEGGEGGRAGTGADPGEPGISVAGSAALYCTEGSSPLISNCILWNNDDHPVGGNPQITYSCVQWGYPGIGNIDANPLFASSPAGDYFLSQIAAGQIVQSPCVDAGSPSLSIISGTTRTDSVQDGGIVDMGYHYFSTITQPLLVLSEEQFHFTAIFGGDNPEPQSFQISNPSAANFNYEIIVSAPWLSVDPAYGGPVPPTDTIMVSVDIAGLSVGNYSCEIVIIAEGAISSPDTIDVDLFIGEPILNVPEDTLAFIAFYGSSNPDNKVFYVKNNGQGTFNYTVDEQIPWLSVTPGFGGPVPPTAIETVSVDASGLAVGTYAGDIYITTDYIAGEPDTVHVILVVTDYVPISGSLRGILEGATTYIVRDDITVESEDSLWIEPGACFMFEGDYHFNVDGYLQAGGAEEDSIIFKPYDGMEAAFSITFEDSSQDSSCLEYCTITGSAIYGLYITYENPTIKYCTISYNSEAGIKCEQASPNIIGCSIIGNSHSGAWGDGGGLLIEDGSSPYLYDCTITNNYAEEKGGGIAIQDSSNPVIDHCSIIGNLAGVLGGGIYMDQTSSATISNCTVSDNNALMNGGGIYIWSSNPTVKNTIVSGNYNRGVYFNSTANGTLSYNDLFGNEGGDLTGNVPENLGVLVTININGDSCDIYSNIFLDPLFVYPDTGNYYLQAGSPCIDAGDPESPLDPDSTIADMGAFYFDQLAAGTGEEREQIIPETYSLHPPYPNPFNPVTTIRFGLPVGSWVTLEVFDVTGRRVTSSGSGTTPTTALVDGWRSAGYHEVTFDASDLASGIYFYRIQAGDFGDVKKMVLIK